MLDLHRLRLLREVHIRGTLQATAGALGCTPSAVSQQFKALEREVGVAVIERVGRGVRLTDAGHVLVRHADLLLQGVEAAEAEVAAMAAGRLAGTVRISTVQSAFLGVVAPSIRALGDAHPGIRTEVTESEVQLALPALRLQVLDVIVGDEYEGNPWVPPPELHREAVLRDEVNVVLPANHAAASATRVRLADLKDMQWAAGPPGTMHHEMHLRVCRQVGRFEPDLKYTTNDFTTLLELVRTAAACVLLPDLATGPNAPGVITRPLQSGAPWREVFLLARHSQNPTVQAVTRTLSSFDKTTSR